MNRLKGRPLLLSENESKPLHYCPTSPGSNENAKCQSLKNNQRKPKMLIEQGGGTGNSVDLGVSDQGLTPAGFLGAVANWWEIEGTESLSENDGNLAHGLIVY
jgi:hypothetical protein